MPFIARQQVRGSGLIRTLVVAASALSILLVGFAFIQYLYLDTNPANSKPNGAVIDEPLNTDLPTTDDGGTKLGFGPGKVAVGAGRQIRIPIYSSQGRAQHELNVDGWDPVDDSNHEFTLDNPEIRLRTTVGNLVRITASGGRIELFEREGAFDPKRGTLSGGVVIEIDRRTDEFREKLPPNERNKPDPAAIIRAEMEAIQFDIEYAKIVVPGQLTMSARDFEFAVTDLEVRFNELQNRVELMRVGPGKHKIVLRQLGDKLGLSMSGMESGTSRKPTLVEMLFETLRQRLENQEPANIESSKIDASPTGVFESGSKQSTAALTKTDSQPTHAAQRSEGTPPPFLPTAKEEEKKRKAPPVKYYARFEKSVDAQQQEDGKTVSRLTADELMILRELRSEDRERFGEDHRKDKQRSEEEAPQQAGPREEIALTWSGRLVVQALDAQDERSQTGPGAVVTATGAPARVTDRKSQTEATCRSITFYPDEAKIRLAGDERIPALVRGADRGLIEGREILSERVGDRMNAVVTGPGSLYQHDNSNTSTAKSGGFAKGARIDFSNSLELSGRFAIVDKSDVTGLLTWREERRILEKAVFEGYVTITQHGMRMSADRLVATMDEEEAIRNDRLALRRVQGFGRVDLRQDNDRLNCNEIDLILTTDGNGQITPAQAIATGNVQATQARRTISADDQLIMHFQRIDKAAPPFDVLKAHQRAVADGVDITTVDWTAVRRSHESRRHTEIAAKYFKASGHVTIHDSKQELDVSAKQIECEVSNGREIDSAKVLGGDTPATVRLGTFTVSGREIELEVPDQWAQVSGSGRMTILSRKDLNGQRVDEPVPISISWRDRMIYQGRENQAAFVGAVRAVSREDTSFECKELVVEFDDVKPAPPAARKLDWWILNGIADVIYSIADEQQPDERTGDRFSKEPAHISATGRAIAETKERDPVTKEVIRQARLVGPRLSVNLRQDVSKMIIEGAGHLLLIDERGRKNGKPATRKKREGLFALNQATSGPSSILIQWRDGMLYDFSIDQTRFDGDVQLRYYRGGMEQLLAASQSQDNSNLTYLGCDVLTIDFLRGPRVTGQPRSRMGRIGSQSLRQFQARGQVQLTDDTEGIWIIADELTYERDRSGLIIQGTFQEPARVTTRTSASGRLSEARCESGFYNLKTKKLEGTGVHVISYGN